MSERRGHGAGRGSRRIEVLPIVELPVGVPAFNAPLDSDKARQLRAAIAATEQDLREAKREGAARVGKGAAASLLGRLGGLRRALNHELDKVAAEDHAALAVLAAELLPGLTATDVDFAAGMPHALEFITSERAALGRDVAGGELPDGPTSMLVSAALQLLASRVEFARGRFREASALANDSRQNLAACHEYAAKRALARPKTANATPWFVPIDSPKTPKKEP